MWEIKTYTVTLKSNDTSGTIQTKTKTHGTALELPSLTREGYNFLGWATTENATSATYTGSYTEDKEITLHAVWKSRSLSIALEVSDGYTYGGTFSKLNVKGNTENGAVTYYYYEESKTKSDKKQWTAESGKKLNAGSYYIYATVASTANYDGAETTPMKFTVGKASGSISFASSEIKKKVGDGTFTNILTNTGDGTVIYESSATNVATVDTNGKVTIIDEGETTITATVSDGTNYTYTSANSTVSYTLKVEVPVYYLMERGKLTSYAIGSSKYNASDISTITFKDKIPEGYVSKVGNDDKIWDVSRDGDKTVLAWVTVNSEDSTKYDLYIGADIGEKGKIMAPESSTSLFESYSKCTAINDLNFLDTSEVENMYSMFKDCTKLTNLDVSKFNTSSVTNMQSMFSSCSGLASLDLINFDTSKVKNMSYMFHSCSKLTSLTFGESFNTSSVTDMSYMFCSCSQLTSLDLSNFDTSSVTNMSYMFYSCHSVTASLSNFDTSKVTDMSYMFYGCSRLASSSSNFNTSSVTDMSYMFWGCRSLASLDLSNFDTSKVTDMSHMFYSCGLTSLNLSNFNTSKVENMSYMFSNCDSLKSLDLSNFNTGSVTNMSFMFCECEHLKSLNVSSFNTSKVEDMSCMFYYCEDLTSLDVSNFNTSSVTNMSHMFMECRDLTSLDVTVFNTSNVTNMYSMFAYCTQLTTLDLNNFNTSKVTKTESMFCGCSQLTSLTLGKNFNMSSVTDMYGMYGMFTACSKLARIITTCTEPTTLYTSIALNDDCILYVLNEETERAFETAENYLTVFGSDSDVPRDDGSTDIYRIRTILELVGDSEVSIEIGNTYSDRGVTVAGMKKNVSGDYTPFGYTVSSSIKDKSGNIVSEIDTSRAGTYTVTYKLSDASGEVAGAEVSRTVKVTMIHSVANGPVLNTSEMKAVYWNESGDEFETSSFVLAETEGGTIYNTTLYNYNYSFDDDIYEIGKDTYEVDWAVQPRWANAKTKDDGSYWVWIPRYAYKITYYSDPDRTTLSPDNEKTQYGYIDVIFLKGTSNDEYIDENWVTQTRPSDYKVHPAFQAMTTTEDKATNPLGKWDKELEGIWVAKFEASNENGKVVSKPSVTSWRSITVSDMYQNCLDMNTTLNTHQMKNSEWGAVAYLAYSVYGRNGNELSVNQCSSYYTGAGPSADGIYGSSSYSASTNTLNSAYGWKTDLGKLASTTGNVYGVYDMSGGVWEYTASYLYNNISTSDSVYTYVSELLNEKELKYKQIYASTGENESSTQSVNYELCNEKNIYGDAIYETSMSYSSNNGSWCGDYSQFPYGSNQFFKRGGNFKNTSNAGVFHFIYGSGGDSISYGFRPVLCVSPGT